MSAADKTVEQLVDEALTARRFQAAANLRDHFAGLAMQGMLAANADMSAGSIARNSYAQAAAMLAVRSEVAA